MKPKWMRLLTLLLTAAMLSGPAALSEAPFPEANTFGDEDCVSLLAEPVVAEMGEIELFDSELPIDGEYVQTPQAPDDTVDDVFPTIDAPDDTVDDIPPATDASDDIVDDVPPVTDNLDETVDDTIPATTDVSDDTDASDPPADAAVASEEISEATGWTPAVPLPAVEALPDEIVETQPDDMAEPNIDEAAEPNAAEPVPGLTLSAESLVLGVKEKYTLQAVMVPAEGETAEEVVFTSDAAAVVSVNRTTGALTPKKRGGAVITATAGGYTATCSVQVLNAPKKVTLSEKKLTLGVGEARSLMAALPANTASALSWSTNKSAVAQVDSAGGIVACGVGSATVTVKTFNGKKATCKVTVKPAPTHIAFEQEAMHLSVGQVRVLKPALNPGAAGAFALRCEGGAAALAGTTLSALSPGEAAVVAEAYNGAAGTLPVTVVNPPERIALEAEPLVLGQGEKYTLTPAVMPEAPVDLSWWVKNANLVKISAAGVVTAKKRGTTDVAVTTHNGLSAVRTVQVVKAPGKVTLSAKKWTLGVGETLQLTAKLPSGTSSYLQWTSSKPSVAGVDGQGLVTAMAPGSATITVRTFNGKKATCKVTVKAAPENVTLTPDTLLLGVGETAAIQAALNPGSAGALIVECADDTVAALAGGKLTAVGAGETTVTATAYNGASAAASVTVVPAPESLDLGMDEVVLGVGESLTLTPQIDPGSHTAFSYKSSSTSRVSVSAAGVIKGRKTGSAKITVKTHNGLAATLSVKVKKAPGKISLSPSTLQLAVGETAPLTAKLPSGTSSMLSYESSAPEVAAVDGAGLVTALSAGESVITVRTFNGKKAKCAVTVKVAMPPDAPGNVTLVPSGASGMTLSWTPAARARGYRVYVGVTPETAELHGEYGPEADRAALRGVNAGETRYACVTAWNELGETPLENWASCALPEDSGGAEQRATLTLNYGDMLMLKPGSSRLLEADAAPAGNVTWETTSTAIAPIDPAAAACRVTGGAPGVATVSAEADTGASASVTAMVVDTSDVTQRNLEKVQGVIARHETLLDDDAGDGVIWDMISASLIADNFAENRVKYTVDRVRAAEDDYRRLYAYAFGSYALAGEATADAKGNPVSVNAFRQAENTLYMRPSTVSDASYAYTLLHESGHAVDFNAGGNGALNSKNDAAAAALIDDVRALLSDRFGQAAADAGVDPEAVDADRVVNAVMDYRALRDSEAALSGLSARERRVYWQLIDNMEAEINDTLPVNNGTMVWDALEGATNFAVSGTFGHSYMFNIEAYRERAYTYYYDDAGNPSITTEPWAEFFSAKLMGDAETIAINLSYLPRTCAYFADVLLPETLSYFRSLALGRAAA